MPDHIFRYPHIIVDLAVVDLEDESHKIWQDRRTPRLRLDWRRPFTSLWSYDREPCKTLILLVFAAVFEGVDIRHNVWSCRCVLAMSLELMDARSIPFHTERENSALVAFMIAGDG